MNGSLTLPSSSATMTDSIDLGKPGDFHVHLRDGPMKELVTPAVHEGGVSVCYVMPNLVPPITDPARAIEYGQSLTALDPRTKYLMSLYLSPEVTPEVIKQAAKLGVSGVKVYPAGVTTNSDQGVSDYEPFYPTFAEMERQNMVLNLHGECPHGPGIHVLNAEHKFLPMLETLHKQFPKLRIILEHCTSKAAIEAVKRCGDSVAATITAHHLFLTVDSWGGNSFNFCKPVAKLPEDREALVEAATSGSPKFFYGSDSAPHPVEAKMKGQGAAAGVYTQSYGIAYVTQAFAKVGKLENLRKFVTESGKKFYQISDSELSSGSVRVVKRKAAVAKDISKGDLSVVPFMAGSELDWEVEWY